MRTDSELLEAYRVTHSEIAFAELVERHVALVYRAALRQLSGNVRLAEDVTQEVFVQLAISASKLAPTTIIVGWLYTTTRHAVLHAVRAEKRRLRREQKGYEMSQLERETACDEEWSRLRPVLDDAMSTLSSRDRDVILLRFFEGQSFSAVGATLRLSEDAARVRLNRAVEKLRAALATRGITSTAAALAMILASQPVVAVPSTLAGVATTTALAAASAAGASALLGSFRFLYFMNSTKVLLAAATALAVLGLGSAVYQYHRAASLNRMAHIASAEIQQQATQQKILEAESTALRSQLVDAQKQIAALQAQRPPTSSNPGTVLAPGRSLDAIASRSDLRQAFLNRSQLRARALAERAFVSAPLSPEKLEAFVRLSGEAAMVQLDLIDAMHQQGLVDASGKFHGDKADAQQMQDQAIALTRDLKSQTQQVLGDDAYAQLQRFSSSSGERNDVDTLTVMLAQSTEPLTSDQMAQLADVLTRNRFAVGLAAAAATNTMNSVRIDDSLFYGAQRNANARANREQDWYAPVTDAAVAEASRFLSPGQIVALKQYQQLQAADLQLTAPANPPLHR
jgi:RNA polymerase sigma factor (sigma-70 family)